MPLGSEAIQISVILFLFRKYVNETVKQKAVVLRNQNISFLLSERCERFNNPSTNANVRTFDYDLPKIIANGRNRKTNLIIFFRKAEVSYISTYAAHEIFPLEQQSFPVETRESDLIAFGATRHAMIKEIERLYSPSTNLLPESFVHWYPSIYRVSRVYAKYYFGISLLMNFSTAIRKKKETKRKI